MGIIPFGSATRESDGAVYRFNSPNCFHQCLSSWSAQVQVHEWISDVGEEHTLLWRSHMEWLRAILPRCLLATPELKRLDMNSMNCIFSPVPPSPPLLEVKVGGVSSSRLKPGTLALITCTAQVYYYNLKLFIECSPIWRFSVSQQELYSTRISRRETHTRRWGSLLPDNLLAPRSSGGAGTLSHSQV